MTEPVPVSPAAQPEPPELWWSPTCGLFGYVDGMGTGDSIGPLHARADDAVRLVPARGPDTEVEKPLADVVDDLIETWHDAPDALVGPTGPAREERQRSVDLHHFLGMSWDEYAAWMGPGPETFPARLEPYVRAQHARWCRALGGHAAARAIVVHRFPEDWSWDGDFAHHPGLPRLTCCGRLPGEVGTGDRMAFSDALVTCPGVRTDGETPK